MIGKLHSSAGIPRTSAQSQCVTGLGVINPSVFPSLEAFPITQKVHNTELVLLRTLITPVILSRCHLSSHFSRKRKDSILFYSPCFMYLAVNVASCWVWRGFSVTFSRIFFYVYWPPKFLVCLFLGAMVSQTNVKSMWLTADTGISICDKISWDSPRNSLTNDCIFQLDESLWMVED